MRATVDYDDCDDPMDVIIDKLYEIQVERGLPVYVVFTLPPHRVAASLRERHPELLIAPPSP